MKKNSGKLRYQDKEKRNVSSSEKTNSNKITNIQKSEEKKFNFAQVKNYIQAKQKGIFQSITNGSKNRLSLAKRIIANNQRTAIITISLISFFVGISLIATYYYKSHVNTIYHVYAAGKEIGVVDNPAVVRDWLKNKVLTESLKYDDKLHIKLDKDISFKEERIYKGNYNNEAAIAQLEKLLEVKTTGVEVIIDGKVVGITADKSIVDNVINKIKANYQGALKKQTVKVSALASRKQEPDLLKVKENIELKSVETYPMQILDEQELTTLFTKGTLTEKEYTVVAGDTISTIGEKFGLTTKDMYKLNPQLKGEFINIGDKLNVTALTPLVTVTWEETKTVEEEIPFKTITEKDNTLPAGDRRVKVNGVSGKKQVTYKLIKENGEVVKQEKITEVVISEPTNKVVLLGTKIIPSRGDKKFIWPTYGGYITSYFGPRWGSFHEGIDIAGVYDKTIRAADNGRVIFTGWDGGYGKKVTIDHENGYVTVYAHLSTISVSVGQVVQEGQKIGIMGNTGRSTGTHLHFEVHLNGSLLNPLKVLGY